MGGHGPHIEYNTKNIKETDEEMTGKIQRIELVKHNPQVFHLEFFDFNNMFTILGGVPAFACAFTGAVFSQAYYASQSRTYNFFANNARSTGRFLFGFTLGLAFGYNKFGDR